MKSIFPKIVTELPEAEIPIEGLNMSLTKRIQSQGGNPSGIIGKFIGVLMNLGHTKIYKWGLENIEINSAFNVLDIGCGGGKVIKILSDKIKNGKICGIDHSNEMIKLASNVNRKLIDLRKIEIKQASVSSIPYSDDTFDIVTAFETIQFWPNLNKDLKEVKRILKPSGQFLIINRFPEQNSKWIAFLQLKTSNEYENILNKTDFIDITIDTNSRKNWILVKAKKK